MRYRLISELKIHCMFQERHGPCVGGCCRELATTAVVVDGLASFRCPKHEGIIEYNPDGTWLRANVHHFIRSD